ncbi:hypothetical protein CRUP_014517 [Coryphaenoides rupestris]|nr:hypothetical protein CRUP_014517 [Coryphaenoides rupestris]
MGQEESELSSGRGVDGTLTVTSQYDQQGGTSPLVATGDWDGPAGPRLSPGLRRDRSQSPVAPFSTHNRASISSCPEMVSNIDHKETKMISTKGMTTALSRRRVSCRELGRPECDGWLWKKRKESNWQRFWFVPQRPVPLLATTAHRWINCLITAIHKHRRFITETPDNEAVAPPVDEMGVMIKGLKEGGVSLTGQDQPFTQDQFRKSFIRRNKNPIINEKALTLRALHSTLKAKEAELQLMNKILEDPDLTPTKFRRWKETNEELCQEIEKLALLRGSPAPGAPTTTTGDPDDNDADDGSVEPRRSRRGTCCRGNGRRGDRRQRHPGDGGRCGAAAAMCGLSLSDGEQLVDAEPADVLLEIDDPGSPAAAASDDLGFFTPTMELSLGSLQESIRRELSEMEVLPGGDGGAEKYFYI